MPIGYLARCPRCGEDFNPLDPTDLIHVERLDGAECGGVGELLGSWGGTAQRPQIDRDSELVVYVPADGSHLKSTILKGAAIVGTYEHQYMGNMSGMVRIHFEGNKYGFIEGGYEECLMHAADRHVTRYPTAAMMSVSPLDIHKVGTFNLASRTLTVTDPEALSDWCS
jgi:hypothetical protein